MFHISLLSAFALSLSGSERTASCRVTTNGNVTITDGFDPSADAWGRFMDTYSEVGWGQIHIWSNPDSPSASQMFCAGYVDTFLTRDRIREYYLNFKEHMMNGAVTAEWPASWRDWISENIKYVRKMVSQSKNDIYWKRIGLIMSQLDGMLRGLNDGAKEEDVIDELSFWILQANGDFCDLGNILQDSPQHHIQEVLKCTGFIRMAPDFQDVYFAHNTWSMFHDLHAYLKDYNLNVPEFKNKRIAISTRTGHLNSLDDFWTNDGGLVIFETTIPNFNKTLYNSVTYESVLNFMRAYYATFNSDSAEEWTKEYIKENSGTYNDQYLVLDTKKFEIGVEPKKDLLWMIEQMPGTYRSQDMTQILVNQTFFGSVNVPWFEDIFNLAEYPRFNKENPKTARLFSYYDQPRYLVMQRDYSNITNFEQFKKFMRYNDYKNDPLLIVNGVAEPGQGIEARNDLRPANGTDFGPRSCEGGVDSKAVKLSDYVTNLSWNAILSPEYEINQAFTFKDWPDYPHRGLVEDFKFDWINFQPLDYCQLYGQNKSSCLNIPGCGYCTESKKCLNGQKDGPNERIKLVCKSGWTFKSSVSHKMKTVVITVSVIVVVLVILIFAFAYLHSHGYIKKKNDNINNTLI